MKVNHSFLFLPLLLSLTTALSAQENSKIPYEDFYLKDGSVYHGYIAEQNVATGEIAIDYMWAEYTFDGSKVDLFEYDEPATSLIADGKTYTNVKVLERGDVVKFRMQDEGRLWTRGSEIQRIVRPVYDGIIDLLKMKNSDREVRGHIIETLPGKSIKLIQDNGRIVNLLQKNVALQQRECKNKDRYNIVMQSPFSEEYIMKDGTTYKGVLVAQNNDSGLLTLSDNKGNPVPFFQKDIRMIRKTVRPDFTIVSPKLGENVVRVNGTEYTGITPKQEKSNLLVPADEHLPFILVEPGKLTVELSNDVVGNDSNVSPYNLFKFTPSYDNDDSLYKLDVIKNSKGKNIIVPDANEQGPSTTKFIYDNVPRGFYALYNTQNHTLLLIWVN